MLYFLQANLDYRWQVVIVDDGSTDGTQNVARELTAAHSRSYSPTYNSVDAAGRSATPGCKAGRTSFATWTWTCPPSSTICRLCWTPLPSKVMTFPSARG
ncbi:MAG TPA: glycosyltransferase [Bryobacteraceae bacterium]|nr:glycosyltransferase [Bryobacteraceae bacterium]